MYPVLAVLTILSSQLISGGRAGILAGVFSLLIIAWLLLPRKVGATLIIVLVSSGVLFSDFAYDHLRFDRLDSASYDALNDFSADRLRAFSISLELFMEKPLGYGFESGKVVTTNRFGYDRDIHNTWLRLLIDGGIFIVLSYFLVVGSIIKRWISSINLKILKKIRKRSKIINSIEKNHVVSVALMSTLSAGLIARRY